MKKEKKHYQVKSNPTIYNWHDEHGTLDTPDGTVDVLLWSKWPSYDFIFGVPSKDHKFYGEEAGFFQYRDRKRKRVKEGFYVDLTELETLQHGFTTIFEYAVLQNRARQKK